MLISSHPTRIGPGRTNNHPDGNREPTTALQRVQGEGRGIQATPGLSRGQKKAGLDGDSSPLFGFKSLQILPTIRANFNKNVVLMRFNCFYAQLQAFGDFRVRFSGSDKLEYLGLSLS